jgi:alkylhydroperoxidase family enzyme
MQQGLNEDLYHHVNEYRGRDEFTTREKLAIEYSERFALDHRQIGSEFIERLRVEYRDEEIVELAGLVAFCIGVGRIYSVLDIANECAIVI